MKVLLPVLVLVAALGVGCFTKQPTKSATADFKPVPAASDFAGTPPADSVTQPPPVIVPPLAPVTDPQSVTINVPAPTPAPKPVKTPVKEPKPEKSKESVIVTPDTGLQGRVVTYNEVARFAVLTFSIGKLPASGTIMAVYRNNLKVGEVKVTGPQQDDNTVGDLINGEAATGDEVRSQ